MTLPARSLRLARLALAGALALLLAAPAVRQWLESRMSLHMAVELPLLALCGWAAAGSAWQGRSRAARLDAHGLLAATVASCVLALWMVPVALDLALLSPGIAALKLASWAGAGALLAAARRRITPMLQAFFLGNAAWMSATAGLLYLDAEQQLCVNYLVDDQQATGWALLAWSLLLGAWALAALRPLLAGTPPAGAAASEPGPPTRESG
jgi:hypothetical protein